MDVPIITMSLFFLLFFNSGESNNFLTYCHPDDIEEMTYVCDDKGTTNPIIDLRRRVDTLRTLYIIGDVTINIAEEFVPNLKTIILRPRKPVDCSKFISLPEVKILSKGQELCKKGSMTRPSIGSATESTTPSSPKVNTLPKQDIGSATESTTLSSHKFNTRSKQDTGSTTESTTPSSPKFNARSKQDTGSTTESTTPSSPKFNTQPKQDIRSATESTTPSSPKFNTQPKQDIGSTTGSNCKQP